MKKYTVDEWIKKETRECIVKFKFTRQAVKEFLEYKNILKKSRRATCR